MRFFQRIALITVLTVTMTAWVNRNPLPAQPKQTPDDPKKISEPKFDKLDEEILQRAKLTADAPALLDFLRKRTLPEKERPEIERLVRLLGASAYVVRERASLALVERGVASGEMLRAGLVASHNLELTRRIESLLARIQENDIAREAPAAAVRVLALQKPAKLNEVLLGYLPFADNEVVVDEMRQVLTANAIQAGKADPVLVGALTDRAPLRRAVAAEALGRAAYAEHKTALRKLLADPDAYVRFRAARTLAFAREREVIPVLIDTIPDLPLNAAWQVEDFLLQLAAQANPPSAPMGNDKDSRAKCKDAWLDWWQKHQAKVDLAKLEESPKLLGRTLIVLLDQGRVLELGPDNMPRFEIKNVVFPLDAQILDDDHVLIAEYHGNRVTERNTRGEVVWQRAVGTPLVAQRLANGNTFVATPFDLLEFTKANEQVLNVTLSHDNQYIMKAMKLPNGEIVCMCADARIVRYSAAGKELSSFSIAIGTRLFGGRVHMLPSGRVLVPHNAEGKVVEYDSAGKIVWEAAFEQPIAATRLPNGNTLITSMNAQIGAVEVNRAGTQVWSYQHPSSTRVTRAIRR